MNMRAIINGALALFMSTSVAQAQHEYVAGADCAETLIQAIAGDGHEASFYDTLRDLSFMSADELKTELRSRESDASDQVSFGPIKLDSRWTDDKIARFHRHTKEFLRTKTHGVTQTRAYLSYFKSSVDKSIFREWVGCMDTALKAAQSERGQNDMTAEGIAFRHEGETLVRIVVRRATSDSDEEPPVLGGEIAHTGMTELAEMSNGSLEDQIHDWKFATHSDAAMSTWKALHRQAAMTLNFEGGQRLDVDIDWSAIDSNSRRRRGGSPIAANYSVPAEQMMLVNSDGEWISSTMPPEDGLITHIHFDVHVNSTPRPGGALRVQLERADLSTPPAPNELFSRKSTRVGVVEIASTGVGESELNFKGLSTGDLESVTYRLLEPVRVNELSELCVVASKSPSASSLSLEIIHATMVVNGKTYVCAMSQEMLVLSGGGSGSTKTSFNETFFAPGWVITR